MKFANNFKSPQKGFILEMIEARKNFKRKVISKDFVHVLLLKS
jgi:uncharacterized protein YpbB